MFILEIGKPYTAFLSNNQVVVGKAVSSNAIDTGDNQVELNFHYIVSLLDGGSVPPGVYYIREYNKIVNGGSVK